MLEQQTVLTLGVFGAVDGSRLALSIDVLDQIVERLRELVVQLVSIVELLLGFGLRVVELCWLAATGLPVVVVVADIVEPPSNRLFADWLVV